MARSEEAELPPEFVMLATRMPPTVRGLLVENADPSGVSVEALFDELGLDPARHLASEADAHVMRVPGCLSEATCAVLRKAVDRERNTRVDSVDGAADHQLPLTLAQLGSLIGEPRARSLCKLATVFQKAGVEDESSISGEAASSVTPREIFVRRYTGDTRPWNPFHHDAAAVTQVESAEALLCGLSQAARGRLPRRT